jgi:hypothetical protein
MKPVLLNEMFVLNKKRENLHDYIRHSHQNKNKEFPTMLHEEVHSNWGREVQKFVCMEDEFNKISLSQILHMKLIYK